MLVGREGGSFIHFPFFLSSLTDLLERLPASTFFFSFFRRILQHVLWELLHSRARVLRSSEPCIEALCWGFRRRLLI